MKAERTLPGPFTGSLASGSLSASAGHLYKGAVTVTGLGTIVRSEQV